MVQIHQHAILGKPNQQPTTSTLIFFISTTHILPKSLKSTKKGAGQFQQLSSRFVQNKKQNLSNRRGGVTGFEHYMKVDQGIPKKESTGHLTSTICQNRNILLLAFIWEKLTIMTVKIVASSVNTTLDRGKLLVNVGSLREQLIRMKMKKLRTWTWAKF